ncbi:MAG: hypothetical protein OSB67_02240 [Alphaproteobacteria bacterium]|nr:hypothetical protein [Alphaproteobacteria bacterium]
MSEIVPGITIIDASYDGASISTAVPAQEIGDLVVRDGLALLKGAFPADLLRGILDGVFAWGQTTAPQREAETSSHRIDERPVKSQTPHTFHSHNFQLCPGAIDAEMDTLIRPVFTAMRDLQNAVAKTNAGFEPDPAGRLMRPQVIQYPSGGGFFGKHVHPLEPQRVGLIVGLSEKGRDFNNGGTIFRVDNTDYSFEDTHDMGDIILFRYDLPHWITPIDANEQLDWTHQAGRWTMVLPYY